MESNLPRKRPLSSGAPSRAGRREGARHAGLPAEALDRLGALTDREDLARLYERNVDLATIVRLAGRQVPRETIRALLESPDPGREAKRILD